MSITIYSAVPFICPPIHTHMHTHTRSLLSANVGTEPQQDLRKLTSLCLLPAPLLTSVQFLSVVMAVNILLLFRGSPTSAWPTRVLVGVWGGGGWLSWLQHCIKGTRKCSGWWFFFLPLCGERALKQVLCPTANYLWLTCKSTHWLPQSVPAILQQLNSNVDCLMNETVIGCQA